MIPLDSIKNVAIIRRNGLGDVLCSIPLVLRCKELMPKAKVVLFIEKMSSCLIPYLEGPDEIVRIPSAKNKYFEIAKLAWQRRWEKFDLAFSAKTTPMKLMNFSLVALRAKHRAAYVEGKWHDRFVNQPLSYFSQKQVHQALRAIHLVDPAMADLPARLYPVLKNVKRRTLFSKKTLLISVSNNRAGSALALDRTAFLLNLLAQKREFAVAVSCLPKDLSRAREMASMLTMEKEVFPTEKFDDFMILLNSADSIFVGDGGIVHLAAALRKPALFLYGGTKVWEWGPLSNQAHALFHPGHVMDIPQAKILEALDKIV